MCRSEVKAAYTGTEALCGVFWPISGRIMSSTMRSVFLVLVTLRHTTWSSISSLAFWLSSSGTFCGIRAVAIASKSSIERITRCFDSLFSVIIPITFSLVLGGALIAVIIEDALLTSILCLSNLSVRLNLSRKYSRKSSIAPFVLSLVVGSSIMLISGSISFEYGQKVILSSVIGDTYASLSQGSCEVSKGEVT